MRNKRKLLIYLLLFSIAAAALWLWYAQTAKTRPRELTLSKVVKKDLVQSISVLGNIEANDKETILLSTAQKVTDINVKEGQLVQKGTVLLRLDISDYEYQLRKARLRLDMANDALRKLNTSGAGRKTHENAIKQADLSLHTAQTSYNYTKDKFEENQDLYESGVLSKDEYEATKKTLDDLSTRVKLAEIHLQNAKHSLTDFNVNLKNQISQQKKQISGVYAEIENLQDKINAGVIKSNIEGKIVKFKARPNSYPTAENNTIIIYDLTAYKLSVDVSQYDAVQIQEGQRVEIRIKGLGKVYSGTVTRLAEAAAVSAGAGKEAKISVEITISEPDDDIRIGYEADANIVIKESPGALAINYEAILKDNKGRKYVFAVKDSKAVKRYVETGTETEFEVQILSGLSEGEVYVAIPPANLKEGDLVKGLGV